MDRLKTFVFYTLSLGFISAYFSITAFQGFFILAILGGAVYFLLNLKKKGLAILKPQGKLFYIPLIGHLTTITISSALFLRVKEQWRRLIEQDFFSFSYFLAFTFNRKEALKLLKVFTYLSIIGGVILSFKILYSYYQIKNPGLVKGFWGGKFILGNLLALSVFSAIYLLFAFNKKILKLVAFFVLTILIVGIIVPDARSIYLGFLIGLILFYIGTWKIIKSKLYKAISLAIIIIITSLSAINLANSSRFKWYYHLINKYGFFNEKTINYISSGRITIAQGALDLVKKSWKEGDYLKFLIGWGYGPQKQYNNLPGGWKNKINEYESIVFLTEFINGGILNLFFIIWFYIAAIILTIRILKNLRTYDDLILLSFISATWVNLVYHIFALFWVPINTIYLLILGLLEVSIKRERKLN